MRSNKTIYKIIAVFIIILCSISDAHAGGENKYWFNIATTVSGEGKVYVKQGAAATTDDPSSLTNVSKTVSWSSGNDPGKASETFHFLAVPEDGWVFEKWIDDESKEYRTTTFNKSLTSTAGGDSAPANTPTFTFTASFLKTDVSVKTADDKLCQATITPSGAAINMGDKVTLKATPVNNAQQNVVFLGWSRNGSEELVTTNPYTFTVDETNAGVYEAKFHAVSISTNLAGRSAATFTKTATSDGDEVGLKASLVGDSLIQRASFKGWTKNGGDVFSTSKELSFPHSEDASYQAVFELSDESPIADGIYCRVTNHRDKTFLHIIGKNVQSVNKDDDYLSTGCKFVNSLQLKGKTMGDVATDPSTIIYLSGKLNAKTEENSGIISGSIAEVILEGQGTSAREIADQSSLSNTYKNYVGKMNLYFNANRGCYHLGVMNSIWLRDGGYMGGTKIYPWPFMGGDTSGGGAGDGRWYIIPVSSSTLETSYFGTVPVSDQAQMEKDGEQKYYSTLYTGFPYECKDGVKAWYASEVDKADGKVYMKEITSGKVPAKTPVVLEFNTQEAKSNRLLPIAETIAPITDNLLQGVMDLNEGPDDEKHTAFNPESARVFGAKGVSFSKENVIDAEYFSNNTAYLPVDTDTPDELELVFSNPPMKAVEGYYRLKNAAGKYLSVDASGQSTLTDNVNDLGTVLTVNWTVEDELYNCTVLSAQNVSLFDGDVFAEPSDGHYYLFVKEGSARKYVDASTARLETEGKAAGEASNQWMLEEITEPLALSATKVVYDAAADAPKYVSTLYTSFGYSVDEEFKTYYVEEVTDDEGSTEANLSELKSDIVPPFTGVVVAKDAASENVSTTSYGITPVYQVVEPVSGNLLKGTCQNTAYEKGNMYVLGRNSSGFVGFRTYTGSTMTANKAYLVLSDGSSSSPSFVSFRFLEADADNPTAISEVEVVNLSQSGIWDLQGRKVSRPSKGLYIVNGKKVIVK